MEGGRGGGGREGRMTRRRSGYRTKNKNPTRQLLCYTPSILCLTHIQNNLRPAPRNPRPWLLRRLRYAFWRLCCVSLLLTEPGFGSLSKRWCAHHTFADQSNVLHSFERSRTFCEFFLHALWLVNIAGT